MSIKKMTFGISEFIFIIIGVISSAAYYYYIFLPELINRIIYLALPNMDHIILINAIYLIGMLISMYICVIYCFRELSTWLRENRIWDRLTTAQKALSQNRPVYSAACFIITLICISAAMYMFDTLVLHHIYYKILFEGELILEGINMLITLIAAFLANLVFEIRIGANKTRLKA